jgi:hypothetical protein
VSLVLADLLSRGAGTSTTVVQKLIREAAFEHIMEACPYQEHLRKVLASLYSSDVPNPCHRTIAELVADRKVRHIITTNYDLCLDAALRTLDVQRVLTEPDKENIDLARPVYFKIHGCASKPDSLMFSLTAEHTMVRWKRDLLERLVGDAILITIGYSGRDFEICPELIRLALPVAWNCREEPSRERYCPSPNALRVLEMQTSVAVVGDMADVLESLGAKRPTLDSQTLVLDESVFLCGLSAGEQEQNLNRWRCELFRGIGCAAASGTAARCLAANAHSTTELCRAEHYLGLSQFHSGRYKDAVVAYLCATELAEGDYRYRCRLDAVEAMRCAGWSSRASKLLRLLAEECREKYRASILIRQLALVVQRYETFQALGMSRFAGRIQKQGEPFVRELLAIASIPGARFEHQLAELLATRLGFQMKLISAADAPPLSRAGFRQLGYFVAEATAMRHDMLEGRYTPDEHRALEILALLKMLGARAEAWKFGLTMIARYRSWRCLRQVPRVLADFLRCQYTLLHRLALFGAQLRVRQRKPDAVELKEF